MRLAYFKDPHGNFGDDLNPWLWERLAPGLVDEHPGEVLVGMGTILEPWFVRGFESAERKFVLGSGGGMSIPPPRLGPDWEVVCVRGPLTAAYLGLDPALATTDPAMCIRDLWRAPRKERDKIGFMPHHRSLKRWDWRRTCEMAGLEYVDPRGNAVAVLEQIAGLRMILTEAMHGAICADALRVPWLPLQISQTNYVGKWHDWSASIQVPIHFHPLPALCAAQAPHGLRGLVAKGLRPTLSELRRRSSRWQRDEAVKLLRRYADGYDGCLSNDVSLDRAIDMFRVRLDAFLKSREGLASGVKASSGAPCL